jgi:hypothetical protein
MCHMHTYMRCFIELFLSWQHYSMRSRSQVAMAASLTVLYVPSSEDSARVVSYEMANLKDKLA